MVKRQIGNFVCAILVVLMETNRLVPWLRQSDHPVQNNHAPRARGKIQFLPQSQRFVFKFCHRTFSRVNHTCLTHCNRFQMPEKYHFAATGLFMVKIWVRVPLKHQILVIFRDILIHNFTREGRRSTNLGAKES